MQGVASCDCAIATSGSSTRRAPTDAAAVSELQIIKTVVSHTYTHTHIQCHNCARMAESPLPPLFPVIVMISCHLCLLYQIFSSLFSLSSRRISLCRIRIWLTSTDVQFWKYVEAQNVQPWLYSPANCNSGQASMCDSGFMKPLD